MELATVLGTTFSYLRAASALVRRSSGVAAEFPAEHFDGQPGVNGARLQAIALLSLEVVVRPTLAAKAEGRLCRDPVVRRILRHRLPSDGRIGRGLFPSPNTEVARLG